MRLPGSVVDRLARRQLPPKRRQLAVVRPPPGRLRLTFRHRPKKRRRQPLRARRARLCARGAPVAGPPRRPDARRAPLRPRRSRRRGPRSDLHRLPGPRHPRLQALRLRARHGGLQVRGGVPLLPRGLGAPGDRARAPVQGEARASEAADRRHREGHREGPRPLRQRQPRPAGAGGRQQQGPRQGHGPLGAGGLGRVPHAWRRPGELHRHIDVKAAPATQ
mmetsp:Transcript_75297/g.211139  ORF Transcript_75297/g.211139 Transcript_75297/m.211139 type:complete len:220 (-) Transcript_75297:216-875(-)